MVRLGECNLQVQAGAGRLLNVEMLTASDVGLLVI